VAIKELKISDQNSTESILKEAELMQYDLFMYLFSPYKKNSTSSKCSFI
jgi:hypothetical protein